jgi:hypothetical protein
MAAALVGPGAAHAQSAGEDSAVGSLTVGVGRDQLTFDLDAVSGPSGERPTGTVVLHSFFRDFTLGVTCLEVAGTRAVIGARATEGSDTLQAYLVVVDAPAGQPDLLADSLYPNDPAAPATCEAFDTVVHPNPGPATGAVVITDAPATPLSRAQCRHGGWRQFGFPNQGRCVAFVVRRARLACVAERAQLGRPAFRRKHGTPFGHRRALRRCVAGRVGR